MDLPKSHKEITEFHKLMLIKIMRPDRVIYALETFIRSKFGDRYIDAIPFNMDKTNSEATKNNPILFLLFPGVDPTADVQGAAERAGKTTDNGKFLNISMGQGQEKAAGDALRLYAERGDWLFL